MSRGGNPATLGGLSLDLETVTVAGLRRSLDAGHLTSAALVRACLDRVVSALLFAGAGGSAIGATAGYPSVSVPAGYLAAVRRPPSVINPSLFRRTDAIVRRPTKLA